MSETVSRRSFAFVSMLLGLVVGGAPATVVAQPAFDVLHAFDNPPSQPYGALIKGSDGALYGTTYYGGAFGYGVIFKLDEDGSNFVRIHDFDRSDGANPSGGLIKGSDGALYGTTQSGGMLQWGAIFRINEDGSGFAKLHDFDISDSGGFPEAALLSDGAGTLYGTTRIGGAFNNGVIFKISENGTFTKLHDFDGLNGAHPFADLLRGLDGRLYGTTFAGGSSGYGVVFRITEDGSVFEKIHDFDYANGANPYGGLVQGTDGLYGTTSGGGPSGYGVVFRINETGSMFAKLHDFDYPDGANPQRGLARGNDGALYGTTQQGGTGYGVVFRITEGGNYSKLHQFNGSDGYYPVAALLSGPGGILYGSTLYGGTLGRGVIFKIAEDGSGFAKLQDLGSTDGAEPWAGMVRGSDGALYGTTRHGGALNKGVVFKANEDGSSFTKLHDFEGVDGVDPVAGLTVGSDGGLYGTTRSGGVSDLGTVFRISEEGAFLKLHDFDGTGGSLPTAPLLNGLDGALYGTTSSGGAFGQGTVFRISEGGDLSTLHDFDGPNGASPDLGGLVLGADGALYGHTSGGGAYLYYGVVYRLTRDGSTFTKLHDFDHTNGAFAYGSLLAGSDGALYGTTNQGGSFAGGVVYKINPDGSGFLKLRELDYLSGGGPYAGLLKGSDGALYGTTAYGGRNGQGIAFKVSEDGSYFARLHDFDQTRGAYPYAPLMEGSDGAFYGTASYGGPGLGGVVFRLVPEADSDGDGSLDSSDNCPNEPNPDQLDSDFDGTGNACDPDDDNDGFLDEGDNCPVTYNPDQTNGYGGPAGDLCEDTDADGYLDAFDNCPVVANPDQQDSDFDGRGDVCDPPNLSVSSVSINEEMSGFVNAGFIVSLFPPSTTPVTVHYQTTPGTASPGSDYVAIAPTTLSFSPGQTAKSVSVRVRGDARDEDDETYYVDLSNPLGAEILQGRGVGTILDDDPTPTLSVADTTVVEGSGHPNMRFTVTLSAASGRSVVVGYTTQNGTADAPADYTPQSGQVTLDPGQSSRVVNVPIVGDLVHEADETVLLMLFGPVNATIADGEAVGLIQDDDPEVSPAQASIGDVSLYEGAVGTVQAIFTVTLSQAATQTTKVDYATAGGTAAAPSDYASKTGTLTFQAGQTSKTISVAVKGDSNQEVDETFVVNLSNPQGLTILDGQGTAVILNDDGPPSISIADRTITEGDAGNQGLAVTVSLSGTTFNTVTVDYATAQAGSGAGFATSGVDYVAKTGTLTFQPGQKNKNVTITIKGDLVPEGLESFFLNLASATNATVGDGQATLTILDNEP